MRKRLSGWTVLTALIIFCAFGSAGGAPAARTPQLGGVIYALSEYSPREPVTYPVSLRGKDGSREAATSLDVEFLKGPETLKELYTVTGKDGKPLLTVNIPPEGSTGEAVFRLQVQTASFSKAYTFTAQVRDPAEIRIVQLKNGEEVEAGQTVSVEELWNRAFTAAGADSFQTEALINGEPGLQTDQAVFDGKQLTLLKPGRVEMEILASPGIGYERRFRFAVYTPGAGTDEGAPVQAAGAVPAEEENTAGPENESAIRMVPIGETAGGERTAEEKDAGPDAEPVIRMIPAGETAAGEKPKPEDAAGGETGSGIQAVPAGAAKTAGTASAAETNGLWIYGPETMKAGDKKFFKPRFDGEAPRKARVTWSLDCEREVAEVFSGNGQVWIRPKTAPGTVITLTCRVRGKDAKGNPWTGEASMRIKVR